jgi:hypothetical protein
MMDLPPRPDIVIEDPRGAPTPSEMDRARAELARLLFIREGYVKAVQPHGPLAEEAGFWDIRARANVPIPTPRPKEANQK